MNKNTRNEHDLDESCKQKKKIELLGKVWNLCTSYEATSSHYLFLLLKILVDLVSNWENFKSMQSLSNTNYKMLGRGLNACEASFERLDLMNVITIVDQIGPKVMSKEQMEGVNLQYYQHSTLRVLTPFTSPTQVVTNTSLCLKRWNSNHVSSNDDDSSNFFLGFFLCMFHMLE